VHRIDGRHHERDAAVGELDAPLDAHLETVGEPEVGVLGQGLHDPLVLESEQGDVQRRRRAPSVVALAQLEVHVAAGVGALEPVDLAPDPDLGGEGGGDDLGHAGDELADAVRVLGLEQR
jgi:hypothetical protein